MSTTNGTFVATKLRDDSVRILYDYAKLNRIPNLLDPNEYHCTIINSPSKINNHIGRYNLNPSWVVVPSSFAVFTANLDGKKTNCCVLTLEFPEAVEIRKVLNDVNGLGDMAYVYEPHITLSYDIGDFDISCLPKIGVSELHMAMIYEEERKNYASWKSNSIRNNYQTYSEEACQ